MNATNQKHHDCISSDRVEGTAVFGSDGDKIGSVDCVMIEKRSGKAREAVVDVGTFLGMGGTRHTIPWSKLDYDEECEGYKLDVTEEQLRNAPSYSETDRDERAADEEHRRQVYEYYAAPTYWGPSQP